MLRVDVMRGILLLATGIWLSPGTFGREPFFMGLGDLPGGEFASVATAVSGDGLVVVGWSNAGLGGPGNEAFRWTREGGMIGLGDVPGGSTYTTAQGVSADGSVVVGNAVYEGDGIQGFRWTQSGGMVPLGDLGGVISSSEVLAISADGSVIVGWSYSPSGREAFRWTANDGMVGLGDLPGGGFYSVAWGVSDDGSVIVGGSRSFLPNGEAFRWENGLMTPLGYAPGTILNTAHAVSGDGSVVVGAVYSTSGTEAFRWTQGGGMAGLGHLPGFPGIPHSEAEGASGDGSVIVGNSSSSDGSGAAFIWDETNGMRKLKDVLVNELGLDLTGWKLTFANGVSSDGTTVVGRGYNPSHNMEAWIAYIPKQVKPALDIKPGSCPNPVNRKSRGKLPVALLGTDSFDASLVDRATVRLSRADGIGGSVAPLEGPPGPHSVLEDVGTPFDGDLCGCHESEGDGTVDLSMKFSTPDVVENLLLNDLSAGTTVELVVSGSLLDGTSFRATDCVRPVPAPDVDGDGDVDGFDFLTFANCYNGTARPPHKECPSVDADMDADGDVDGFDFLTFANCFNGSDRQPICP